MTTTRRAQPLGASAPGTARFFRLPDIPEKHPDDMTSFQHLAATGNVSSIAQYLGNSNTTIVSGERYIVPGPAYNASECRYPDLLVAFGVDPAAYQARNGYMVSEQGKPPDFILEVGSQHTASADLGVKKDYYERIGVGELWLYDSEGEHYGFKLRGYRLENSHYQPIDVAEIAPEVFEGYSATLNLLLRAGDAYLGWHDPDTGEHIPTLQSQTERAETAEARAERESAARIRETERAERESAARARAEARAQELEAELRRLREGR